MIPFTIFFFLKESSEGASLPRTAELCWLRSSLAGAQRSRAAHNSPSRTSYGMVPSQSPSPINLRAIHSLKVNNIPQVSLLLPTLESHPIWLFYYVFSLGLNLLRMCCAAFPYFVAYVGRLMKSPVPNALHVHDALFPNILQLRSKQSKMTPKCS